VSRMDSVERTVAAEAAAVANAAEDMKKALKRGLTPPSSNTGGKGRKTAKKSSGGSK
jgi:hypothetical protein